MSAILLAACGGGGGGGSSTSVVQSGAPSVTGDMIAYQANRGWNYQGNAFGQPSVTLSVYADPPSGASLTLVGFGVVGASANAFGGMKLAALGLLNGSSGYDAASYVLLNNDGSTYAQGAVTGSPLLVPQTLVQGQSFTTYPGGTATVQTVGAVPGASACPTPANGATVQYTFAGGTYLVSYVPGCGITNYVGNHGEHLTLTSVGSYPALGVQSVRRMDSLTTLDSVRSLARVLMTQARWAPFPVGR